MLIDTHAHVNFVAYKDDGEEVTKRALKENIWMINVGSEKDTSRRAVEYAQKYPEGVFASVGLHPIHLAEQNYNASVDEYESDEFKTQAQRFDYKYYKSLVLSVNSEQANSKVVAIGEIGLDYFHNEEKKLLQRETLLEQLNLADQLQKPVMFHCREAHNDLLEILKNWNYLGNKPLRGVIHSFSGRWSQAQLYLEMGFYLGFNGIITFARDYDRVIKQMPLDRLVLETDCPYLTPEPFRGKRNEPAYVRYVGEKVAELREISFEEVAEATSANAKKLFNI
jgi:TatD DNase family protein